MLPIVACLLSSEPYELFLQSQIGASPMTIQFVSENPDPTFGSGENIRFCIDATGKLHLAYTVNNQLTYSIGTPGPFNVVMTGTGPLITQTYRWNPPIPNNVLPAFTW